MTYIATYKTKEGVTLKEDCDCWYLEGAYEEAQKKAERNHWKLLSVKPKEYPPIPQVVYYPPHYAPWNEYHDYRDYNLH